MIQLAGLTKSFGERVLLDDVTWQVTDGERVGLCGPNGAGKSALMQLITFQDRPVPHADESASVRVFGKDVWHVFELRPQLGVVSGDLHHRFAR